MKGYQTCRVCGARILSGFTNCDRCYYKAYEPKPKRDVVKGILYWLGRD